MRDLCQPKPLGLPAYANDPEYHSKISRKGIRANPLVLTKTWSCRAALATKGSSAPRTDKQMLDQRCNSACQGRKAQSVRNVYRNP